jgi:hypothetical protein
MDACIFVLAINMAVPVYMADRTITKLNVGDQVCVMQILPDEWMQVHWSTGNVGHTGYLRQVSVYKEAEPTAQEHQETPLIPPPPPSPAAPPPGRQTYLGAPRLPHLLAMECAPAAGISRSDRVSTDGGLYGVVFKDGTSVVDVVSGLGNVRSYPVIDRHDDQSRHTLYVAAKRVDQDRTLYFAFDYSRVTNDVSAIRVEAPGGYDARDKCLMDWKVSGYAD